MTFCYLGFLAQVDRASLTDPSGFFPLFDEPAWILAHLCLVLVLTEGGQASPGPPDMLPFLTKCSPETALMGMACVLTEHWKEMSLTLLKSLSKYCRPLAASRSQRNHTSSCPSSAVPPLRWSVPSVLPLAGCM